MPIPRDFYSSKYLKDCGWEEIKDVVIFRLEFGVRGLNCEWTVCNANESVKLKLGMRVCLSFSFSGPLMMISSYCF